ncbi:MAG: prepilin-type N-terminal cleavage/methylation domain-containing protein [Alphaproteobacteria bacterium]|nr:prepilin-type N-terminal cleavage/methylation domain-containing protein [Alphaproteobacteria bacterium]
MTTLYNSIRKDEGFTLVELAVVMIIIGLLVGGILKGQEMIANTQVTTTIAQVKAIDAAVGTFRDMYDAFPGDMAGADTRLVGCTTGAACAPTVGTLGNQRLEGTPLTATLTGETGAFFPQLSFADLISGLNASNMIDTNVTGHQFVPGYVNGAAALGELANPRGGHYLAIISPGGTTGALKALDAARMDRKLDDGIATTGSTGAVGTTGCHATGVYDEDSQSLSCGLVVRIQG